MSPYPAVFIALVQASKEIVAKKIKKPHLYLCIHLVFGGISININLKWLKYILVVEVWSQVVGTLIKLVRKGLQLPLPTARRSALTAAARLFCASSI